MDQEETMALSREKPAYNALIQDINNSFCIEQNSNEIDNNGYFGISSPNMHNPSYQFNDDIIPIAAEILAQITIDYLND